MRPFHLVEVKVSLTLTEMKPLNALSEIFDKISMFLLTRSSSSSLPPPPAPISLGNSQKWKMVPGRWWKGRPWCELVFWSPRQSQEESQSIHTAKRPQLANACSNISQLVTIVLATGRKKKMDWCVLFSPTDGIMLGPPISITQHRNGNLQVEEKLHHTRIPLLARTFQERGANGVFQVKQFFWWTISVWGYSLFVFISVGRCESCPVCTWIGITRHSFALLVTVTWGISVTLGCRTWIYSRECWHGLASSPSKQTLCD